jgi:hypothetical protein
MSTTAPATIHRIHGTDSGIIIGLCEYVGIDNFEARVDLPEIAEFCGLAWRTFERHVRRVLLPAGFLCFPEGFHRRSESLVHLHVEPGTCIRTPGVPGFFTLPTGFDPAYLIKANAGLHWLRLSHIEDQDKRLEMVKECLEDNNRCSLATDDLRGLVNRLARGENWMSSPLHIWPMPSTTGSDFDQIGRSPD